MGYTGRSFAKKLGIPQSTYTKYEKGQRVITKEREQEIKQILGFEINKERANLKVSIDYLKLTFFDTTVETIMEHVLGIEPKYFTTEERRKHNYEFWHSCGSIILMSRRDGTQGVLLDLTSEGLKQFEEHLGNHGMCLANWLKRVLEPVFYESNNLYSRIHSTRLDLAIDEMYDEVQGNFDLTKLQEKKHRDLITTPLRSYQEIKKIKGQESHGTTIMFGTRGNDRIFMRFYEKRYELANKLKMSVEDVLEEYKIWNRYELELGREVNPHVFTRYLSGESLEDIAIDLLLTKIEVYEEIETKNGLKRLPCQEWYNIFAYWKKIDISASADEISLEKSMRWIEKQVVPILKMMKIIFGEKWVFDWLRVCMEKAELTPQKEKQLDFERMLVEKRKNGTFLYFDKKIKERKENLLGG